MSDGSFDINEVQDLFESAVNGLTRHFVVVDGIISDVSDDSSTCDVDIRGATFYDVPVKVLIGSRAATLDKPTIGANCLMMFRDGNLQRPQLFMCDQADIQYNDIPTIIFQGGKNGGIPMAPNVTKQFNNIENLLLNLIQLYNTHTHPVTAVNSPTGVPVIPEEQTLTPTTQKDIENPNISQ